MTNTEFVNKLMERSKHGALMQLFILTAIEKYAEQVKLATEDKWSSNLIDFGAWQSCAAESLKEVNEHLGGRTD